MNNENTDLELEQKVLGSLIIEPNYFITYHNRLSVDIFSSDTNQILYTIIKDIWEKHNALDLLILERELKKRNLLELIAYAVNIVYSTTSPAHFEYYVMLLVQLSVKRDFVQKFSVLLQIAKNGDSDVLDLRDKSFQYFDSLFIDKFIDNNKKEVSFSELVEKVQKKFEKIKTGVVSGIESSLSIINNAFGGWQNSDLTIVAGRPGMGKTAFLVQQVVDVVKQGKPAGIFSLEMSAEQITSRVITNFTRIPNSSILRKGLKDEEIERYIQLKPNLVELPIYIDDTPNISIENLKLKAKMMQLKYGIEILFVDYLQLISCSGNKNREQEISTISRNLKALAKELNIPVIALSQLSRNVEQRSDKRPLLSDLRDSGSIEQDADSVVFLYRPEYYGIETWGKEYGNTSTQNQVEIIIQKNRHGGTLSSRCGVNLALSHFTDLLINF